MDRLSKAPRGFAFEGRAAGRGEEPARGEFPKREYHAGDGAASRAESTPLYAGDDSGKIAGVLVRKNGHAHFAKVASASRHQERKPPAWALDAPALAEAEAEGATEVRVTDRDSGRVFVAPMTVMRAHGFMLDRGLGLQVALELRFWRVESAGQPRLWEVLA